MSEATEAAPEGMTFIFGQRAIVGHHDSYNNIASGNCFKCQSPQKPARLAVSVTLEEVCISHQCSKCGYANVLVQGTVRTMKSDPSLNRADM